MNKIAYHVHTPTVRVLMLLTASLPLAVASAASLTWRLSGGGNWNTTAANWTDSEGTTVTFTDGATDDVAFTNAVGGTITIAADMSPLSTTVDAPSGSYIFNGGPIDSGHLVKSGAGTLRLNNANTYPDGTFLKTGTLQLYNNTAAGPGTIMVGDSTGDADATLHVQANIANPITVQAGSTGELTLHSQSADGRNLTGPITLGNNLTIQHGGDRVTRLYGDIDGSGNLTLANAAPTTRGTHLNLDMASVNPVGDMQVVGIGNVSVSAAIGGNVADITQGNSAFVTFTGANAYTGAVTVNAGTLLFRNLASWSQNFSGDSAPTPVTVANADTTLGISMGGAGQFADTDVASLLANTAFGPGTFFAIESVSAATLNTSLGGVDAPQNIEKLGSSALTLTGANTYTGMTRLSDGTLIAGSAESEGVSGPLGNPGTPEGSILFNGGALGWSAANTVDYTPRFAISPGASYGFNVGGQTVTLAGALPVHGVNDLMLGDNGMLVLSGANAYSGQTQVYGGGTLSVASLNRVVDGSATSHLGAPTTDANGTIVLGRGRGTPPAN